MGSCLPILVIAYIDHLNIPTDCGTHQINYSLPCICNVSNEDFEFVMKVDRNKLALGNAYGKLPFRDSCHTPHADAPMVEEPVAPQEVPVVSSASLDDWLHQPGSNSQSVQQLLPPEHQQIALEFNSIMEQDVNKLTNAIAATMKDKIKATWRNRSAQMMAKMGALNKKNEVSSGISLPQQNPNLTTFKDSADKVINVCPEVEVPVTNQQTNNNVVLLSPDVTNKNASSSALATSPSPELEINPHPSPSHMKIRAASNNETIEINNGTSTRKKKNRRKRAAINLNFGKNPKKIKLDEETKLAYGNYLSKRLHQRPITDSDGKKEDPPFVQIAGFYVSYDEFYESLTQRGKVDNNDQLIVDSVTFKSETCKKELKRLNNTWKLSKMDLQINFNSINASTDTPCFESSKNLIANFSEAVMESGVIKEDLSQFEHIYPTEYPQQYTLNDCGLYTMLYIQSWNRKKVDVPFEATMIADYRKFVAGSLLCSPMNEIVTSEFVEKHCIKG